MVGAPGVDADAALTLAAGVEGVAALGVGVGLGVGVEGGVLGVVGAGAAAAFAASICAEMGSGIARISCDRGILVSMLITVVAFGAVRQAQIQRAQAV